MQEGSNNSSKTPLIIGLIGALVLVGGGIWYFTSNNSDETSDTASTSQTEEASQEQATPNIVVLATQTPSLSTLVAAVQAAELVDTLQSAGPFTVFAPTDDAFAKLPAGTLDSLLLPENRSTLSGILTYHVVSGQVLAQDLSDGQVITTVNGGTLTVRITDGKVQLVDATGGVSTVEQADVNADNGVVHIIDSVLLPS